MYIGKHHGSSEQGEGREAKPIHIPENYAGNAFVIEEKEEEKVAPQTCFTEAMAPFKQEQSTKKEGYFGADSLFSTDTLLVLLAILLFGKEENGEIAIILLLLLLF